MIRSHAYFICLCLLASSCKNEDIEKIRIFTSPNDLPVERGVNIQINYTDSGFTKARVFAPILERFSNEERAQTVMQLGIRAYFYDNKGKISSSLKSKYAVRNERTRTMTAQKDVVVVNVKGDTLRTEELIWVEQEAKIRTNKFVRITTPEQIIYGDGMESNTEFTNYKIFNIKGIISLKK